jgi:enamine deaminase RidA (YjgF/YER057c/UK114 family)
VAGQVGWNAESRFESDDLVAQIAQAMRNIAAILACDGAGPEHVTNLVWHFIDKREYINRLPEVGNVYREIMGKSFPAMTAVQVSALIEDRAKVDIQATAVIPD